MTGTTVALSELLGRLALLARAFTGEITPSEIIEIVVRQGMAGLDADGGILVSVGADGLLHPVAAHGYASDVLRAAGPLRIERRLPLVSAARDGEAVWVSSRDDGHLRYPELAAIATASQAWAAIPLVSGDVVIGALGVTFRAPRPFRASERAYLRAVAGLASLALAAHARRAEASSRDVATASGAAEIALLDPQGVIVEVNDAWSAFAVANGGDLARCGVGSSYLDVCDRAAGAPGANEVGRAIRAVLRGRVPSVDRVTIPCHAPGAQRWFDVAVAARLDERGRHIGATVMITPTMTDRGIVGLDDATVRAVLDVSPDATIVCDRDGVIRFANDQVETVFGHDRTTLVGSPVEVLLPSRLRDRHVTHRAGFAARPVSRPMGAPLDLFALRRDGREVPVEVALAPLDTDDGPLTIATVRDVSARRARESHERSIRRGLDLARDGVVLVDSVSGAFVYANDGFCRITGYGPDELARVRPDVLCPSLDDVVRSSGLARLHEGTAEAVELTCALRHRDGHDVVIEAIVQSAPDEHGARTNIIAVVRDVGERLRRERAHHDAHEAQALAADRERIAGDLRADVVQRLFAGGMALAATCEGLSDEPARRVRDVIGQIDDAIRQLRYTVFDLGSLADRAALVESARRAMSEVVVADGSLEAVVRRLVGIAARAVPDADLAELSSTDERGRTTVLRSVADGPGDASAERVVQSSVSVPVLRDGAVVGVLAFHAGRPGAFGAEHETAARHLASSIAPVLANATAYWDARDRGRHLERAMQSRAVIEQAKGMLMAHEPSLAADDAFELLKLASQRENVKLREIAERIVLRARPGADHDAS